MTRRLLADLGEHAFRWRSYLPLVVVLGLLAGALSGRAASEEILRLCVAAGSLLALAGLLLRLYAVGHAPAGTSGRHRTQHAAALNTFGIYSVMRHPLYAGNVLVWTGVSLASGWPLGALASTLVGLLLFGLIVAHEDRFLARRFGDEHAEWASATPAFLPRPGLWRRARRPFQRAKAIASEYSTLHSIGLLFLLLAAARGHASGEWPPGAQFWLLLALNSTLYLSIRLWRRRRA